MQTSLKKLEAWLHNLIACWVDLLKCMGCSAGIRTKFSTERLLPPFLRPSVTNLLLDFWPLEPIREPLPKKKMFSFGHCPNYHSPSFGQLVHLFRPSKINIYIVFFNSGKGLPPPHSGNARKKTFFFGRCSLTV